MFLLRLRLLVFLAAVLRKCSNESTSKEINCAEHEYMNMSPSLIALAPLLVAAHVALRMFIMQVLGISESLIIFRH